MKLLKALLDQIEATVKREPVRVAYLISGAAVFALAKYGIAVPKASVFDAVVAVLPMVFGGEVARSHVSPTKPS